MGDATHHTPNHEIVQPPLRSNIMQSETGEEPPRPTTDPTTNTAAIDIETVIKTGGKRKLGQIEPVYKPNKKREMKLAEETEHLKPSPPGHHATIDQAETGTKEASSPDERSNHDNNRTKQNCGEDTIDSNLKNKLNLTTLHLSQNLSRLTRTNFTAKKPRKQPKIDENQSRLEDFFKTKRESLTAPTPTKKQKVSGGKVDSEITPSQEARLQKMTHAAAKLATETSKPKQLSNASPKWLPPATNLTKTNNRTATSRQKVEKTMNTQQNQTIHKQHKSKQQRRSTKLLSITNATPIHPQKKSVKSNKGKFRGFMCPRGPALDHPFAETLLAYAETGCTVDCGEPWSLEQIEAAIARGAHSSAKEQDAAEYAWREAEEKAARGYCQIYKWKDLKLNCPKELKISPLAAIPHKSRAYRLLLDLSFGVKMDGTTKPSVNETTVQTAPHHALDYIGTALPRIIHAVATAATNTPCLFAKADIKDGFWRVFVEEAGRWNFAYVLPPRSPTEEPHIVVPNSTQMGWVESMYFFCAASETARDVSQQLLNKPPLPQHPLENIILPEKLPPTLNHDIPPEKLLQMFEVYVDDFLAIIQAASLDELKKFTRAFLWGIESIFPEGISIAKLEKEGRWDPVKEILGWIFDGVARTMRLPNEKLTKIVAAIKQHLRAHHIEHKELERLNGKLRHAAMAMPWANGLFHPINKALATQRKFIRLTPTSNITNALRDFTTIIRLVEQTPTPLAQLIPAAPDIVGRVDASKKGAGGVWYSRSGRFKKFVWQVEFPPEIQRHLEHQLKGNNNTTNSDLEAFGFVCAFLVLEHHVSVQHQHIALYCDNTPTVSWVRKLSARSARAARLMRILAIRMKAANTSPLLSYSIPGKSNQKADYASRVFFRSSAGAHDFNKFVQHFNTHFHCTQLYEGRGLPQKLVSKLTSEMQTQPSRIDSWLRLQNYDSSYGATGSLTLEHTASSRTSPNQMNKSLPYLRDSQRGLEEVPVEMANEFGLRPFASRFLPSARPSFWTDRPSQTHSTPPKES